MKNIVLFDLDGTLSPARKAVDLGIILNPLKKLQKVAEIGIVTGSGNEYVIEQASSLLEELENIHVLPCNGTQYYKTGGEIIHSVDMQDEMGEFEFHVLMQMILKLQNEIASKYPISLTGHFVNFRGSMINWCPIGRNANSGQRERFKRFDEQLRIRSVYLTILKEQLATLSKEIVAVLGGNTSFDVYPSGWDKTYALKHFEGKKVYFVGDKCPGDRNDRTICEEVGGNCFPVSDPGDTARLIGEILIPLLKG